MADYSLIDLPHRTDILLNWLVHHEILVQYQPVRTVTLILFLSFSDEGIGFALWIRYVIVCSKTTSWWRKTCYTTVVLVERDLCWVLLILFSDWEARHFGLFSYLFGCFGFVFVWRAVDDSRPFVFSAIAKLEQSFWSLAYILGKDGCVKCYSWMYSQSAHFYV